MMNDIVRSGEIHKGLGKIDNELKDKITLEKKILFTTPELVLKKVISLPANFYFYFLGEKSIKNKIFFKAKIIEKFKSMVNNITINLTKKISMSGYKVFPKYIIPSAKEVLEH